MQSSHGADALIEVMSGALTFAYFTAGLHFLRFWRRTSDGLFLRFALAFWLFMLNQLLVSLPLAGDGIGGYEFLLRILGFVLILVAIAEKNIVMKK